MTPAGTSAGGTSAGGTSAGGTSAARRAGRQCPGIESIKELLRDMPGDTPR